MKRIASLILTGCLVSLISFALAGPEIIVPDEFKQTGTMPVYTAAVRDFGVGLDPALFNQSGVAKEDPYDIVFNDGAQLSWAPEAIFYEEFEGTYSASYDSGYTEMIPLQTLSSVAADLAGFVHSGWPDETYWEGISLENTTLSDITLDEANERVEALLAALRVEGYTCDFALDMDIERIQSMGMRMNLITQSDGSNSPNLDYSQVTEANEGFYLHYHNTVETGDHLFDLNAYVTRDGIADLHLRDMYIRGGISFTPETLVSPETVLAALPVEMANSPSSGLELDSILSIELTYTPARAENTAEGMVFTPAWYIVYRDTRGAQQDYDRYAIFNAVNGELLYAVFQ